MASSPKCISILLLVALIFSTQVFARDSQFFSKVSNNNVNNDKETTIYHETHNKQEQDEDPLFVPESETGGYALYGHESGQLPPSTTTTEPTTYEPYTTVATGYVPRQQTNDDQFSQETYKNSNNYYNRDTYDANHPQENNMAQTSFAEETYTTNNNNDNNNNYRENQYENNNNNYQYENKNNKQYTNERQGMSDTRFMENGKYHYDLKNENQMRQGMSDTRFMENGKYFYDVKNENTNVNYNYNPNQNSYTNGRSGYNGNTYEYRNNNNMEEFQNAEVDEDNFNDEQFEP